MVAVAVAADGVVVETGGVEIVDGADGVADVALVDGVVDEARHAVADAVDRTIAVDSMTSRVRRSLSRRD